LAAEEMALGFYASAAARPGSTCFFNREANRPGPALASAKGTKDPRLDVGRPTRAGGRERLTSGGKASSSLGTDNGREGGGGPVAAGQWTQRWGPHPPPSDLFRARDRLGPRISTPGLNRGGQGGRQAGPPHSPGTGAHSGGRAKKNGGAMGGNPFGRGKGAAFRPTRFRGRGGRGGGAPCSESPGPADRSPTGWQRMLVQGRRPQPATHYPLTVRGRGRYRHGTPAGKPPGRPGGVLICWAPGPQGAGHIGAGTRCGKPGAGSASAFGGAFRVVRGRAHGSKPPRHHGGGAVMTPGAFSR